VCIRVDRAGSAFVIAGGVVCVQFDFTHPTRAVGQSSVPSRVGFAARMVRIEPSRSPSDATQNQAPEQLERCISDICGGERTRTADFYVANVALYQLSYTPVASLRIAPLNWIPICLDLAVIHSNTQSPRAINGIAGRAGRLARSTPELGGTELEV
jgi:hypothetical protein